MRSFSYLSERQSAVAATRIHPSYRPRLLQCRVSCVGLLLLIGAFTNVPAAGPTDSPHIVFILADDMGSGDIQALNPQSRIPTPHLNKLAQAGMVFRDAHSPSAVCTPTRYGLLTGRYCFRSRLKRGVLDGYSPPLIDRDQPTVASLLREHHYTTAIVGKWHLGLEFARTEDGQTIDYRRPVTHGPNELGFDSSYIIPASLDFPPYVYLQDGRVTEPDLVGQAAQQFPAFLRAGPRSVALEMEECLDHLTDQVVHFIEHQSATSTPFFLYFPLTAPHKPVLPHPRFHGRSELGPYGDFVMQVDECVGRVLQALQANDLEKDTLVFYSSDNGSFMFRRTAERDHVDDPTIQAYRPTHHTANGRWRGTKADIWEGGHRVPLLARWPGRVPAGSVCETPVCLVDLMATAADLVGADRPASAIDSYSLLPLLQGQPHQRPPIIHHSANGMFSIRDGRWKLVLGDGSGGREKPQGKPFARPYQLFDLANDPAESTDEAANHPEVARRLEEQALSIVGEDR